MTYNLLRQWVLTNFGDELASSRLEKFEAYIASRMQQLALDDEHGFIQALASEAEQQLLLDAITVPESYFYRFSQQLEAFFDFGLPELLRAVDPNNPLPIFCCACSTGEEAYTLTMMAQERNLLPRVKIFAADINQNRVNFAAKGCYQGRTLNFMPPIWQEKYFEPIDSSGTMQVKACLRQQITWTQFNLLEKLPPQLAQAAPFGAIFCRNVLIYFNKETTKRALQNLNSVLKTEGLLALGHSERVTNFPELTLERIDAGFFYRKLQPGTQQPTVKKAITQPEKVAPKATLQTSLNQTRPAVIATTSSTDASQQSSQLDPPCIQKARKFADQGAIGKAVKLCEQALSDDPMQFDWQYLLGQLQLDAPEVALNSFRKAVYLAPDNPLAHYHLALCAERLGQTQLAIREFTLATTKLALLDPFETLEHAHGPTVAEFKSSCQARLDELTASR